MPLYVWKGFWRGRLSWMNREFRNERKKTTTWQQAKHAKKNLPTFNSSNSQLLFWPKPYALFPSVNFPSNRYQVKQDWSNVQLSGKFKVADPRHSDMFAGSLLHIGALCIPYVHTKIYGQRAFSYSASTLWNNLLQLDQPQIPLLRSNLP